MQTIAYDIEKNRVHIDDAVRGQEYFCPVCGAEFIVRKGEIKAHHFAHKSKCSDSWHYDMSEWHLRMQNLFPKECQEIVRTYDGETHRADVLMGDVVLEFQHSPISSKEYRERTEFWMRNGYKVAWIFDVTEWKCQILRLKTVFTLAGFVDWMGLPPSEMLFPHDYWQFNQPKQLLEDSPDLIFYHDSFALWFYDDRSLSDDGYQEECFTRVVDTEDWEFFNERSAGARLPVSDCKNVDASFFIETQYPAGFLEAYYSHIKELEERRRRQEEEKFQNRLSAEIDDEIAKRIHEERVIANAIQSDIFLAEEAYIEEKQGEQIKESVRAAVDFLDNAATINVEGEMRLQAFNDVFG